MRHNCINIETYLYISETSFNCDKFVTDRDNNIYKSDNFYLYNKIKWVGLSHSHIRTLMWKVHGVCSQPETREKPQTKFVEISMIILDISFKYAIHSHFVNEVQKNSSKLWYMHWKKCRLAKIIPFILFLYTKFLEMAEDTIVG